MSLSRFRFPSPSIGLPPVAVTVALSVFVYAWLWPLVIPDVTHLMVPWLEQVEAGGPIGGIAAPVGNYPPAYAYMLDLASLFSGVLDPVTLVKLVAVASVIFTAVALRKLLRTLDVDHADRIAALVLILPSAAINGPLFAQCDGFWVAPCLLATAAAIERRHVAMLAWCGVGLAFKSQTVFAAPFVLAILIARRVSWRLWPIPGAVAIASTIPALLAGWPVRDLALLYVQQVGQFPQLSFNAPNIWAIAQGLPGIGALPLKGLAMACAIGTAATYIAYVATAARNRLPLFLVRAALLSALVTCGTLPLMHERYFFLADILALALAAAARTRDAVTAALLVQIGSVLGLFAFLSGIEGLAAIGAVPMIAATVMVVRSLLSPAANDNVPSPLATMTCRQPA